METVKDKNQNSKQVPTVEWQNEFCLQAQHKTTACQKKKSWTSA